MQRLHDKIFFRKERFAKSVRPVFAYSGMVVAICILLLFFSSCSSTTIVSKSPSRAGFEKGITAEQLKGEFITASFRAAKGDYWGAIDHYRRVIKQEPDNAAVNYFMAKAFSVLDVSDSAMVYSEKAVSLSPDNLYYLKLLAGISHRLKDYKRAAEILTRVAALEPGHPENLALLALAYLSSEQPEKALDVFQEMLRLDPENERTQAQVLLLEIKLRHYQEAIGTLKELIGAGDEKEKLRLTLGELYLQTGQRDLAVAAFRSLVKDDPLFVPAWLALFEVSVQAGDQPGFIRDLHGFYTTKGVNVQNKIDLAQLFFVRSVHDSVYAEPYKAMMSALEKNYPGESRVYELKASASMQQKKYLQAIADFKQALALDAANFDAWEGLVSAYIVQNDPGAARKALMLAKRKVKGNRTRLLMLEGYLFYHIGETKKAVVVLEKALSTKDAKKEKMFYMQASVTLALCFDRLGIPAKSIRIYETILLLDPDNALAMNNLAYILSQQGSQLDKAKTLALGAVAKDPESMVYLDTLGWVYYKLGEYDKAEKALEKAFEYAVEKNQVDPEIMHHLIMVYEKLGYTEKIRVLREKTGEKKSP
ncbi:Tetratricopeptide TPR_2 repeat protein [Chlorobium phaeobacteroides DSM 266]|uniref:Tetratricopeptide TPR_2 repeat protein n=1 Tax=Chlorobium phaeobacteroides (strain DSM 266 / SMG 266 / 2430) TaxID=290317 RepID=A1BDZ9_CHLPD|nr:Tetratricopeptide TPR_2 repeat protein [Chlorobium phaeobacteroides DSM 266]